MNAITIVNTIRANEGVSYQERIPELTKSNFEEVGNALVTYEAEFNAFCNALVNKIGFTQVSNRRFKNPLAALKSGTKPFGTDIEEIYINPVSAVTYNGSQTDDMLKITKPDVKTIYHRQNRQDKYPVSITIPDVQKAFTNEGNLTTFIQGVINAMYSGDEMDEFLLMKNTVAEAITASKLKTVPLTYDGSEATCKDLIKLIKTLSHDFTEPSTSYNGYNVLNADGIAAKTTTPSVTWAPKENQIIIIRSDVDAATDVDVLAKAFNMDKTDLLKRKFVVSSFGDDKTLAVVADEKLFKITDDLYTVRSFDNGSNLARNYWLHHWQTLSLSLFANAVAIQQATE